MKRFKKIIAVALAAALSLSMTSMPAFAAAEGSGAKTDSVLKKKSVEKEFDGSFFSATGFAAAKVKDRSNYKEGDSEYKVVSNEEEFLSALKEAKKGNVKVIELRADMNLGWWELSDEAKNAGSGVISAYSGIDNAQYTPLTNPTLIETGLSDLRLSDIDGLTIFSQYGNTIRHAQFQLQSTVNDFVMRNIAINEVWEWDDFTGTGFGSTGGKGTHKRVGWTPMKINGSKNVWLDHCSFGLGFDGCVDLENGAEGISITWSKVGDTDTSVGSMLYKTVMYMEQLYQESKEKNNPKTAFTAYRIMRDNGMTLEQIMEFMAYHSKVHLCGAGDKDTWLTAQYDDKGNFIFDYTDGMTYTESALKNITNDLKNWLKANGYGAGSKYGTIKTYPNFGKTDANELIELTLAYNQYWNVGQRVPMIRGGVGHLYNCYINDSGSQNSLDAINTIKNEAGETVSEQIYNAGSGINSKLQRTMNARNGASIAADTCVWQNVNQPVPGAQYQKDDLANMNSPYHAFFEYNYTSIVNSKVQKDKDSEAFTGNSYDNDGKNDFMNAYNWKDASVDFSWHNLAIKNAYRTEGVTDKAVALEKYDKLTYDYQTFPLDSVEEITNKYSGFNKIKMSASDWLKTSYDADFVVDSIEEDELAEATAVQLDKSSAVVYMDEGEHLQLAATIVPSNTKQKLKDLVWTSSDETIAKVNDSGLVSPVKYGEATITVKLGDFTATCNVSVRPSPQSITVTDVPETIYTGDIFTLGAVVSPAGVDNSEVVWNSLTRNLEVLDRDKGIFQAVAASSSLKLSITSKFVANRVGYQELSVENRNLKSVDPEVPVTGITFDKTALSNSIKVGDKVSLSAKTVPENATNQKIYWTSSDESVATVDENGNVTAVSGGSAVIEAKTMNWGFAASCEAVVINDEQPEPPVTEPPTPTPGLKYELGDVNMDGSVDLQDATLALKAALNIEQLPEEAIVYADVDGNGSIDLADATNILKAALNIVSLTKVAISAKLGL